MFDHMTKGHPCPNCSGTHGPLDNCALGVVLGMVRDRQELKGETITAERVAQIDVDEFWDLMGPAISNVEDQLERLGAVNA